MEGQALKVEQMKAKPIMGYKVRISNESINCYGTRVITSGVDLSQYERNPVLLYMHERGTIVGKVNNLHVDGADIVGELAFDCATELSTTLKKQWEFGSLRMVSANFQVLETSKDKNLIMEGQTRETITRSKLFEVSVVDIGGNDDAIVLSSPEGKEISLAAGEGTATLLPLLNNPNINPIKKVTEMELKTLALSLGLAETATEAEVSQKLEELKLAGAKVKTLETENAALVKQQKEAEQAQEALKLAAVTQEVERAVQEKRISAQKKDHFIELGKQVGIDSLKITLSAIQPQGKISTVLHRSAGGQVVMESENDFSKYEKLSAVPGTMMDDLIDNHHADYVRLFKAEYGMDIDSL